MAIALVLFDGEVAQDNFFAGGVESAGYLLTLNLCGWRSERSTGSQSHAVSSMSSGKVESLPWPSPEMVK